MKALAALLMLPSAALAEPGVPVYVPEDVGISTAYAGEYYYMVGGGVAAFDCSGDRFPDLVFAGGEGPVGVYVNRSEVGGALAFDKVQSGAEIDRVQGVWPIDIDSDGGLDLVLLRLGEDVVLRGLGDCRFERANEAWGFQGGAEWSTALAAIWERGQGWPTLAVGAYIDQTAEAFPWGSCTENRLYRPAGQGFAPPLPLTPSFCALSMLFTDWDRSGTPSLRIANDREYYKGGQEQLWHLPPDGSPRLFTEAEGWKRLRIWGMGIASADLDWDGYPEYFLTSMADNKLQALREVPDGAAPVPVYDDIALKRGVTAHRPYAGGDIRPSTAWHAEFGDVNNDGRLDLFVVKGNVAKMPDFAEDDPNNLLLQGADGVFVEAGDRAGVASMGVGRGGAVVDLNLDGALDLVATRRWEVPEVWRQAGCGGGHWVQVALHLPGANRNALGAVLEIRHGDAVERREVTLGGGQGGGKAGWLHIGLGDAEAADLRVIWPDGSVGDWLRLAAGGFFDLSPGAAPVSWSPGGSAADCAAGAP
ncbi:CRTAC1 family protein [Rhodobacter sp. Har01]|uniref:CRTAC1 family protein n=1 Tax=Rhodobacter sp. Har01 TaxID=2883999 RepID=UPI001D088864|nr:CRTAC1 family protein [Rhodobacter sp. Har01]MCB6176595.1 CRTAC1 family protein [Rhodobacter sp. Har01]